MSVNRHTAGAGRQPLKNDTRPRVAAPAPILSGEKLKALYSAILKSRMLQERLVALHRRHTHAAHSAPAFAEGAVLVGASFDLLPDDSIAPSPRAFIADFVHGAALAEIFSASAKCWERPLDCTLQLSIGAGLALAIKNRKQPNIAVCLLDEELLANHRWKDAVAFAGARKLPLVCLVLTRSLAGELRNLADGCETPAITVDGSDLVAVYRVMQEAIRRARQGHGPTLLECKVQETDPVIFMENYLRKRALWSDAWQARVVQDFATQLERGARARR